MGRLSAETVWKAEACASVSVRLGARNTSPTRKSSKLRGGTTVKPTGSKEPGRWRVSVCEFMCHLRAADSVLVQREVQVWFAWSTFGALNICVQGLKTVMGRSESRRIIRPASDYLDVARRLRRGRSG